MVNQVFDVYLIRASLASARYEFDKMREAIDALNLTFSIMIVDGSRDDPSVEEMSDIFKIADLISLGT